MFQVRLSNIIRKPMIQSDYEQNAQMVIDSLQHNILNMDLSHIKKSDIVRGDKTAIMNLVDIFVGISEIWLKRRFRDDAIDRIK